MREFSFLVKALEIAERTLGINHPNTVAIYKLSQRAKEYVTVLLSGEGADEVFVNRVMVRDGLATPLTIKPNDTYADDFRSDAATAKSEGRGNWALCPDF